MESAVIRLDWGDPPGTAVPGRGVHDGSLTRSHRHGSSRAPARISSSCAASLASRVTRLHGRPGFAVASPSAFADGLESTARPPFGVARYRGPPRPVLSSSIHSPAATSSTSTAEPDPGGGDRGGPCRAGGRSSDERARAPGDVERAPATRAGVEGPRLQQRIRLLPGSYIGLHDTAVGMRSPATSMLKTPSGASGALAVST